MKTIKLKCEQCNKTFSKPIREHRRSQKVGRKSYCSIKCAKSTKENLDHLASIRISDVSRLKPDNRKDEYTIYRYHLRKAKARNQECTITLEDLKQRWEEQNKLCNYLKIPLEPRRSNGVHNPIYTMSLDRIDSTLGYIPDNIQFISLAMNYLKHSMTEEMMQEVITLIKNS